MDAGNAPEEQPVLGHCEIDAGSRQHPLAEEAERGDRNSQGNQSRSSPAQCQTHHVAGGGRRQSQTVRAKDIDADERDRGVQQHDSGNAEQ